MPAPDQTPTLGLSLGADADENANWEKLDNAARVLALGGTIIPDDLIVQGALTVTGQATLNGGIVTTLISAAGLSSTGPITAPSLTVDTLTVNTFASFPPEVIEGGDLRPDASVVTVASGTANTTLTAVGNAALPIEVASVASSAELPNHWSLVLAQATVRVILNTDQASPQTVTVTYGLWRGGGAGAVQQTRQLNVGLTRANLIEIPITMVRIARPPTLDQNRWALQISQNGSAVPTVQSAFAQMHLLQLR